MLVVVAVAVGSASRVGADVAGLVASMEQATGIDDGRQADRVEVMTSTRTGPGPGRAIMTLAALLVSPEDRR